MWTKPITNAATLTLLQHVWTQLAMLHRWIDAREFSPKLGAALNKCEQTHCQKFPCPSMHEMFAHSCLVCTAKVHDGHV